MDTQALFARFEALWHDAVEIWVAGGWAMPAIAFSAAAMFALGVHVWFGLRNKQFESVPEATWRRWIESPSERSGALGELIDFVTQSPDLQGTAALFRQLPARETARFERDLKVMRICVSAAPLLGLLGTVTGMLATFEALASGSGGEQTMDMIAKGISEALITTETGLVIALPGLFFQYQMTRKFERYKAFLAHLETVTTQSLYRRLRGARAA